MTFPASFARHCACARACLTFSKMSYSIISTSLSVFFFLLLPPFAVVKIINGMFTCCTTADLNSTPKMQMTFFFPPSSHFCYLHLHPLFFFFFFLYSLCWLSILLIVAFPGVHLLCLGESDGYDPGHLHQRGNTLAWRELWMCHRWQRWQRQWIACHLSFFLPLLLANFSEKNTFARQEESFGRTRLQIAA